MGSPEMNLQQTTFQRYEQISENSRNTEIFLPINVESFMAKGNIAQFE